MNLLRDRSSWLRVIATRKPSDHARDAKRSCAEIPSYSSIASPERSCTTTVLNGSVKAYLMVDCRFGLARKCVSDYMAYIAAQIPQIQSSIPAVAHYAVSTSSHGVGRM